MRRYMWEDLLRKRDSAWDEAERVSLELGFPFIDRHNVWRNADVRRDLSHQALVRWCDLRGIVYA